MKPVRIRQMKRMNHNRIPGIWRLSSVPAFGDGWWDNPFFQAQPNDFHNDLAEGQGFEPWVPFDTSVFKTGAFNRSATPPEGGHYTSGERGDKAGCGMPEINAPTGRARGTGDRIQKPAFDQ